MTAQQYQHFNPTKYELDVKIATIRTGAHCKYNINYHIIWIPKFRKKLLYGKVKSVLETIIRTQCEEIGVDVLALEVMPDHIHLFVGATPTHTPFKIIKQLKGYSSMQLRRCFGFLKYLHYTGGKVFPSLWAIGYYCGSAGHVSQEAVKRYIQEQQGKDVFEYSVFGNPQQKIGDFTQSKLSGWS